MSLGATGPARGRKLVTGVIGADTHIVGNRILSMALEDAGFEVIALGALTPAEDFVKAAIETAADAIMVSSLYGQGELDCRGFRDMCVEAGLEDILIYVGGNLVVGKQDWADGERRFLEMGFDRAFPPNTRTDDVLAKLNGDFAARARGGRIVE
jgi:methylaspartate mutase sigma subunit